MLVIIGTLILCSSYTEDYWYLPIDKDWGPYAALGIICVGAIVHELRPWKVRPRASFRCSSPPALAACAYTARNESMLFQAT